MQKHRAISDLKSHPLNDEIYGDEPDNDLIDSVMALGVLEPLLITKNNVIVSGHQRCSAAMLANLETVPVKIIPFEDQLDLDEMLIHANCQRNKTNEMRAREFQHLKRIESERARERMRQGGGDKKSGKENLPDPISNTGQARDIAASRVGMSGRTAEKAAQVVDKIDDLEKKGEREKAQNLRTELNDKSIRGAHKATIGEEKKPAKKAVPKATSNNSFLEAVNNFALRIDSGRESGWPTIGKDESIKLIQGLTMNCYGKKAIMESGGEFYRNL